MSSPLGPIHIVGLGRLGGALRAAWSAAGVPWVDDPAQAQTVVITTPDDAIAEVAASLAGRLRPGAVALHCAGALNSAVLRPSGAAAVGSLHPVQTIAHPNAGPGALAGAWAGVEGDPAAVGRAEDLARAVGLRTVRLTPESKPLWHAAAVLACNDLVALLHLADRLLVEAAGAPQGVEILLPLVRATLDNVERHGLAAALTGPVARGDEGTVARHLAALEDHPAAKAAYEALAVAARDLARRAGS